MQKTVQVTQNACNQIPLASSSSNEQARFQRLAKVMRETSSMEHLFTRMTQRKNK